MVKQLSIWHGCKLVQIYGNSPGTPVDNDHAFDFIRLDNASLIYKNAPLPQPVSNTAYSYEVKGYIEATRKPRIPLSDFRFWGATVAPDRPRNKILIYLGTSSIYTAPINTLSTKAIYREDTTYYSSANSLMVPGTLTNIGDKTAYIILQVRVLIGAGQEETLNMPHHFKFNQGAW